MTDSALPLPLLMLAVFGSAKLLAALFERFGLPGIAGEIVAGVLIGPGILAWVHPEGLVSSLGDLGVMFLLFRVGLEIKSSELSQIGARAAAVAAGGVALSFSVVWAIFKFSGASSTEANFIAAAMAATSAGITAHVLSARGLLSHAASRVIVAAAVIDDVAGLLVLTVVSGAARGHVNVAGVAVTLAGAVLFIVMIARWGGSAMQHLTPRAVAFLKLPEAEFVLSICLLFALALFSTYTGVAAIVGAFLAGMALGESTGTRVRTLVHGATELLVPFFLAGIGLRVNVAELRSPRVLVLALVLLIAAVGAKLIGCGAGMLTRGWREALQVGSGMIPRGEVTMVVAQLGMATGFVSQGNFGVVVLAAVATTLVAPPLIGYAFSERRNEAFE